MASRRRRESGSKLLHKICNSDDAEFFDSDPFEIAGILWKIRIDPKATSDNYFNAWLCLESIPSEWESVCF